MDRYLVNKPGLHALPRNVRAASYDDVPVARDRAGLLDGALDAVCDEGERRSSLRDLLRHAVGEDEVRHPVGCALEPSTLSP